tara:strand:- start:2074 stop:2940 length:867 start_codon:yes stop_codon:yes gene_type:complete
MKVQRIGTYKTGFKYFNNNKEIINNDIIDDIKTLKIPPAYDKVTIINGVKIIAYGYDSKNRKQVIYNPKYILKRSNIKFKKIEASVKHFSKLKKKISNDIKDTTNTLDKICAIIITLIIDCGFRIGNKKYEKDNNSYGLTTLKKKHIFLKSGFIEIDFIGKKSVRNKSICKNKYIYKYLNEKIDKIENEEYIFDLGNRTITSQDVNKYLAKFFLKYDLNITTKDLRTLNANNLFMKFFAKTKIDKNVKNPIKKAIEYTANNLHNTYDVCKKNYIDPNIIKNAENELNK